MDYIIENFKKSTGKEDIFIKSTSIQMDKLRSLLGKEVEVFCEFYSEYQPYNFPLLDSGVTLIDIQHMIDENMYGEPGKYLAEYGVFVFGVTIGGNVLCIDTNDIQSGGPGVRIIDSIFCSYNECYDCVEIGIIPDDVIDQYADDELVCLNYTNIVKCTTKIEDSFREFMLKLSQNDYEDIEDYL